MKFKTYAVSLVSKAEEQAREAGASLSLAYRAAGLSGVVTALSLSPAVTAFALETGGASSSGTNLLSGEVMEAITNGFSSLVVTATAVVAIAATTGVSIIGLSAACKYAMKKIKGVLSSAQ